MKFMSTRDNVDVRVESNTLISTDVYTHDNDTSDAECDPVVESTGTILVLFLISLWNFLL